MVTYRYFYFFQNPERLEIINFIKYVAPPSDDTDQSSIDEWMERAKFIEEDLHKLLQLPHDKFWCHVIFDGTLHQSLDSYLKSAPRYI